MCVYPFRHTSERTQQDSNLQFSVTNALAD